MLDERCDRPPRRRVIALAAVASASLVGCSSEPVADVDPAEYRVAVNSICATTRAEEAELVAGRDPDAVEAFSRDVAALLTSEAEALRAVTPPGDVAADHRAFIQNTDDQARRWTALATTPPDDTAAFGAIQTEILELTLGRDDLATEMALDACRRTPP